MPRVAIASSQALAGFLRRGRQRRGFGLREVEQRSTQFGEPIPFSTLAKIEQGKLEPGAIRTAQLFQIYCLPLEILEDLLTIEMIAGPRPESTDLAFLLEEGIRLGQAKDIAGALAHFIALRDLVPLDAAHRGLRQTADLNFALVLRTEGKLALSNQILEELLQEGLEKPINGNILIGLAQNQERLGCGELSQAFAEFALRPSIRSSGNESIHYMFDSTALRARAQNGDDTAFDTLWQLVDKAVREGSWEPARSHLTAIVIASILRGRFEQASKACRQALQLLEQKLPDQTRGPSLSFLAYAELMLGHHDEAERIGKLALDANLKPMRRDSLTEAHYVLYRCCLLSGDPTTAEIHLESALRLVRFTNERFPIYDELRVIGEQRALAAVQDRGVRRKRSPRNPDRVPIGRVRKF